MCQHNFENYTVFTLGAITDVISNLIDSPFVSACLHCNNESELSRDVKNGVK